MEWLYFGLGVITTPILWLLAKAINTEVIKYRQKRLLKLVSVIFPDREDVTLISIDANDKRAMTNLERRIREQYDVPDEDDPRNRG